jgi:hypothetical protein
VGGLKAIFDGSCGLGRTGAACVTRRRGTHRDSPSPHSGRVSVASAPPPPQTTGSGGAGEVGVAGTPGGETCPLCGAPLHPEQEWCLRCGAAARTRLAASSNWKAPIIALAAVATLSLGVLAAALVKLAGGSSSTTNITRTIVRAPASVTSPDTATTTPAPSATTPGATTPSASTPVAVAPVGLAPVTTITSSIVTLNGTVNPQGVPTTYQFQYGATASYGGRAPGTPAALGTGASAVAVSARIAGLAPGTTYHYKLTASKAGRAISTADATFTTPGKTGASGPAP